MKIEPCPKCRGALIEYGGEVRCLNCGWYDLLTAPMPLLIAERTRAMGKPPGAHHTLTLFKTKGSR